jgi:integrase
MRLKESFTLYRRKLSSGKNVFYYQMYDEGGKRICGHSTGKTSKIAAREYCMQLMREGKLLPVKQERGSSFAEYAAGWWDFDTCKYVKYRMGRREITRSYVTGCKYILDKHLLPHFGPMQLNKINDHDVDTWLTSFSSQGYSNATANNAFKILHIMMEFAIYQHIIMANPCSMVKMLKKDTREIKILSPQEMQSLFPANWETIWDDYSCYIINKLAACTGMRLGELLGLRSEFVFDGYIKVAKQFSKFGYTDVKTHKPRIIPLPKSIEEDLRKLIGINGPGYIFARKPHEDIPIQRKAVYDALYTALSRIGITEAEREKRHLSMHGWRHFFNTTLLMADVPDTKVMAITGHSSKAMKEHYTHFNTVEFTEVRQVQEDLMKQMMLETMD